MPDMIHIGLRLTDEEIARIDAVKPLLSTLGHDANRSEVLRVLILCGLERLEKDLPKKPPRPTRKARKKT